MFHYLFTNDLRITTLESSLVEAARCFRDNCVPSADIDKNANNNMNTLGFYFNLTNDSNCTIVCSAGNVRKVVLNFIKKFQFPNPRTSASLNDCFNDGIQLAPMRVILQVLYMMQMINSKEAYLSNKEIADYIFFNENIAKVQNPNIAKLVEDIISNRVDDTPKQIPEDNVLEANGIYWNQCRRQIREMVKILSWSGCVIENSDGNIVIGNNNLTRDNKADIFEIITFNEYWKPDMDKSLMDNKEAYQRYMDISGKDVKLEKEKLPGEGKNIIFYGVPGCGKSHHINDKYSLNSDNSIRVVFHPDYTYSDFVGQILPQRNGESLVYPFVEGPFTKALMKAKENKNSIFYLIIEEINRGNAPAIFGDIFQLLDRDENGDSEYPIKNPDIAEKLGLGKDDEIRIPGNLMILATMNTADQNVFTLDTAFKRRWKFKAIPNDFDADSVKSHVEKHLLGNDKYPTWKEFATKVNDIILSKNDVMGSSDKRLGVFFLRDNEIDNEDDFSEKVLMYLWNDVFTFDRSPIFKNSYNSLEKLISDFKGVEKFNVFNIQWDNTSTDTEVTDD